MSKIVESEVISRRRALSLLGLAALGLADHRFASGA